ncbi:hypothetical protein [Geodermatophilus sabuli]|uniref:Uncharacterized protein n=1 Tax=Geodermatophilus sabuli TaxID=1564158 RepID=A0A285EBI1_9ACTN|nr:hypothetical protein [Geodermatophilus sabuli]MBB3085359.1 hypothetical protein [Geodermatophilus sabuli]SNX96213.1 hypothetical protein SAMN06893097_103382 [Geodermatophilus sabuli]
MFEAIVPRGPASDVPPEVTDRSRQSGPAPVPAHHTHWARPDIAGDVLAAARDPRAAPPREIRIRPELYQRLLADLAPGDRAAVVEHGALGGLAGVPLVVDRELPGCPGFEVVRALPSAPHAPAWPAAGGPSHAAAA